MRGLYLLIDESLRPWQELQALLPALLATGPALVQHRAKALDTDLRRAHARGIAAACANAGVPFIVNDDLELAAELAEANIAGGVHVGRDDAGVARARTRLGPRAVIGRSCYASIEAAREAIEAGASYVSFGRLFASRTKPEATPATLDVLRQAAAELRVPVCAIGGIDAANAGEVRDAGADLIACAGGVLASADPVAAARTLVTMMRTQRPPRQQP